MNNKYFWDLEDLLEGKSYEILENEYLTKLKDTTKLYEKNPFVSLGAFKKFIKASEALELVSNRIFNYLYNKHNANLSDNDINGKLQALQYKSLPLNMKMADYTNKIIKNKNAILEYLKDPELAELQLTYDRILRTEPHNLSEEVEKFASNFQQLNGSYGQIFSIFLDQDLKFADALDGKNKKHKMINRADYLRLIKNSDSVLRKNAYLSWNNAINDYRNTLTKMLYYFYLESNLETKTRNHEDYIAATAFNDEIDKSFIPHVYDEIKKYANLNKEFKIIRDKILKAKYKLNKVNPWDRSLSIGNNNDIFTIEEAQKTAKEALAVLGAEYVKNLNKAFKERWIDWQPRPNKRSGAYCIGGTRGLRKIYVLLNYNQKLSDVSTLVHELGHAINAVEFGKYQSEYASNRIFYAEIASIANEILLAYYLLKKYKNNKLKQLEIYDELISGFIATTTRQIIFSKFEWISNEMIKSGQPYNADVVETIYKEIMDEYTAADKSKKIDSLQKKALSNILTIPHFYSGVFYVYKYSIGQVVALLTANQIYNGGKTELDAYYQFLRSGSSRSSLETIKLLGIDLTTSQPWEECGEIVASWIKKYKELADEVFLKKAKIKKS